jgi:transcriptional regulator with XRE-family HTH domain
MTPKSPNLVDKHVGSRVRVRRLVIGMSQEKLGEMLGLTFQQVQKYEKGTNRIGSGRLYQIAAALQVPVSFFYEDQAGDAGSNGEAPEELLIDRKSIELLQAFNAIDDEGMRDALLNLTQKVTRSAQ